MKKAIWELILCFVFCMTVVIPVAAETTLTDGDGDGYLDIGTAEELYAFAALVGSDSSACGELTADIMVNEGVVSPYGVLHADSAELRVWTPIGAEEGFLGSFQGNGHTVSGLYLSDDSASQVGLFGWIGSGATVQNVGVIDSYFYGAQDVGGVAGQNDGSIIACYAKGCFSGDERIGGVAGRNGGTITDCYSYAWIRGGSDVGGVAGSNDGTTTNCYYWSESVGTDDGDVCYGVGGAEADVEGSTAGMDRLDFSGGKVAYLLGEAYGQDLDNNQDSQDETPVLGGAPVYWGYPTCIGVDYTIYSNTPLEEAEVAHSYLRVNDEDSHSMICVECGRVFNDKPHEYGAQDNGDGTHTWSCTAESCGRYLKTEDHVDNGNGICTSCDAYLPAELVDGVYQITNAGQLYWFAQLVNSGQRDICAVLTQDIVDNPDMSLEPEQLRAFDPIGSFVEFTGTFDGQGHTVSGLYLYGTLDGMGLVRRNAGVVRNVGVVDSLFHSTRDEARVGGVVGSNRGTVERCWSDMTVQGSGAGACLGGVVGYNAGSVLDCYSLGAVICEGTQSGGVGGALGLHESGTVDGVYSLAQIQDSSDGARTGAVIGSVGADATVRRCYGLQGDLTEASFQSGEVAYLLGSPFGQTVGKQLYPVLDGDAVYQVTDCAGQVLYSNVDAVRQHRFGEDGACSLCGAEGILIPTMQLQYASVSFESEIRYNVYYVASDLRDVVEMGISIFDQEQVDGTVDSADDVVCGFSTDGAMWMVQTRGVAAKRMGQTIYFRVYAKLCDGSFVYTDMESYSVQRYADTILGRESSSEEMKALVVSLLQYGSQAQLFFDYQADDRMDDGLTLEQCALVAAYDETMVDALPAVDGQKAGAFVYDGTSFAGAYPSVSFDGAFSINYYFTPAQTPEDGLTFYYWDAETYDAVQRLTAENATGSMEMVQVADAYWAVVGGIAAKQIDEPVYVTGSYDHDGQTYSSGVIVYSLGRYCETVAARDDSGQQELAKAAAVYGYYAKIYFESL